MHKFSVRTLTQILSVIVAIAALICSLVGLVSYLTDLAGRKKPYSEFPPEYDDYADWDVD